ncbi:hypothetical protein [Bacillus salipaludis]|uniref:hypothetical protein n=1 Tax=Bacillus salipaludis TaxID=2547811 RepID=UPI002E201FAC|nr:hypothetical protein [Bacillus salipaludis]
MKIVNYCRIHLGKGMFLFGVLIVLAYTSLITSPNRVSAATAPPSTTSYYMDTIDTGTLYNMGYQKGRADYYKSGTQKSIVILDFGGQPSSTSVSLRGMPDATLYQVEKAIEEYSHGYWKGTGTDKSSMVHIIVGTNNSYTVTYEGGQNFAKMINRINSHNNTYSYSDQVEVDGGNDMEPGYDDPTSTRAWVKGYDSVNYYSLYNYGSADGCYHTNTNSGKINYSCNNGWDYEDLYYISWGAPPSVPLPQIYDNSSHMAEQWQNINKYSVVTHNAYMDFAGELTQYGSCQQSGCGSILDNTPSQGWNQLYNELNSDPKTAESVILSSDIKWH